jgi:UDP-glucose 4-epimerase
MKSSTLVYGSTEEDPQTFGEEHPRSHSARTRLERSLVEAESLVRDFAEDNPGTRVAVLRFANVLGTDIVTPISRNLSRPVCPSILGYDPLVQFVEEDDVVRSLEHVTRNGLAGIYNVAGGGRLPWSEVAGISGTHLLPLPPIGTRRAAAPLVRLGLIDLPPELDSLLRYGRGVDTRRILETGFDFRYSSAGAVRSFIRAVRLRRGAGRLPSSYKYEHDIEQFFRHSPSVVHSWEP